MAKSKTKWVCQVCEYETASYLGKCPECDEWSSFKEEIITKASSKNNSLVDDFDSYMEPQLLNDIEMKEEVYFSTGLSEFDRVLGRGIVQNSLVLLGGDPGIGKSTILLQVCGQLSKSGIKTFIYFSRRITKAVKAKGRKIKC